jgi:hypothetical protein
VFFEPVLVVPVAAVAGVVGLVLAIVTSPIWLIILWFAYKKHLKDTRDLAEHPSVREAMVSAPASLAANGARFLSARSTQCVASYCEISQPKRATPFSVQNTQLELFAD